MHYKTVIANAIVDHANTKDKKASPEKSTMANVILIRLLSFSLNIIFRFLSNYNYLSIVMLMFTDKVQYNLVFFVLIVVCICHSSPESIKNRNDVFYLVPERSCVPDSPVWYSTSALGVEQMQKMLNRIRMVSHCSVFHSCWKIS